MAITSTSMFELWPTGRFGVAVARAVTVRGTGGHSGSGLK